MTSLLRIDASSREDGSQSRALCDHFERRWLAAHPGDTVVHRDLVKNPVPHIAAKTIEGFYAPGEQFTPELEAATALSDALIAEVQAADVLLISVPIYNFSLPSALKAYIDHVVRIGHTFSYDGENFTGLVTGKRAFVFCAYGAAGYLNDGPFASYDFLRPYLNLLLGFLGVGDVRFFSVEGTTADADAVAAETSRAQGEIDAALLSQAVA